MTSIEHYEKIEDYLKGKLTKEEQQAFEVLIDKNEELAAEVELHRDMIDATGDQEMIDFRKQLDSIADKVPPPHTTNHNRRRWLIILTLILIFAGAGISVWLSNTGEPGTTDSHEVKTSDNIGPTKDSDSSPETDKTQEQLPIAPQSEDMDSQEEAPPANSDSEVAAPVAKNTITDPADKVSYAAIAMAEVDPQSSNITRLKRRSDENTQETSPLDRAYEAYEDKKYQQAVQLLSDTPASNKTEWIYLRGHAHLKLQEFEQAASDFAQLTESFSYGYDADWNLLLSLAAQLPESQREYENQFEKVTAEGHPFAEQANELHDKLEEAGLNQ